MITKYGIMCWMLPRNSNEDSVVLQMHSKVFETKKARDEEEQNLFRQNLPFKMSKVTIFVED